MRQFRISDDIVMRGPYYSKDMKTIFTEIIFYGKIKMWTSVTVPIMTIRLNYLYSRDTKPYAEKLVRYTAHWLKNDTGIDPKQLVFIVFNKRKLTLSMKRFGKVTLFGKAIKIT